MKVHRYAPAALHELLTLSPANHDLSTAAGVPVVVVELGGPVRLPPARLVELLRALGGLPTVTIALSPRPAGRPDALGEGDHDAVIAAACDLVVAADDDDAFAEVVDAVHRTPLAATTFALLLRHSATRDLEAGLVAESMAYSVLQAGPEFAAWLGSRPVRSRPREIGPAVGVERSDDAMRITLARPHVHNAFSARLRDGLVQALEVAVVDSTITEVEVRGRGPSFCSGGDLDEFGSFPDPTQAHLIRVARHAGRLIARLGPRISFRLHGAAMGAGIELPAFSARVVAHPETVIALPELALGLLPGAGGTVSLPARIGRHRTAWLGLTGGRIDAATALEWGLVDAVEAFDPNDASQISGEG